MFYYNLYTNSIPTILREPLCYKGYKNYILICEDTIGIIDRYQIKKNVVRKYLQHHSLDRIGPNSYKYDQNWAL